MFESRVFRFSCFDSFCRLLRQRLLLNVFLDNFPREIGASPAKIDLLARVRLLTAVGIKSRCQKKKKNSSNSCSYDSLDMNDLGYLYRLQIFEGQRSRKLTAVISSFNLRTRTRFLITISNFQKLPRFERKRFVKCSFVK